MLFEFKGKVYEINNFVLIIIVIIISVGFIYLLYIITISLVGIIPHDLFSNIFSHGNTDSTTMDSSIKHNSMGNAFNFNNITNNETTHKNNFNYKERLPYEVQDVLKDNDNPTNDEICYFNGRGRVANSIGDKFDCRKTEDLKIITIKNKNIFCCVTP